MGFAGVGEGEDGLLGAVPPPLPDPVEPLDPPLEDFEEPLEPELDEGLVGEVGTTVVFVDFG